MSSLLDAVLQSDAGSVLGSRDRQRLDSDHLPPSSRPQQTSETNGPMSDMNVLPDDQVVGTSGSAVNRLRNPYVPGPPPVVDVAGEKVQQAFEELLETYVEEPSSTAPPPPSSERLSDKYYIAQIHGMKKFELSTLYVDFKHLTSLGDQVLANAIAAQYYRFQPFLTRALHNLIAKYEPEYFLSHRQASSVSSQASSSANANASVSDNPDLDRSIRQQTRHQQTDKLFSLAFYNMPLVSRLRQLRTSEIGKLVSMSGTITRTSEIRPELSSGTFICEQCKSVCPNVEQTFRYTEPSQCPNSTCGNRQGWKLDIGKSTFVDWQKVKLQESSHEIPTGTMPRTIDVILRGEMVDRAKAGERCIFTGTLIVVPDVSQLGLPGIPPQAVRDNGSRDVGDGGVSGLKSLGVRDLTYRTAFLACMVTPDTTTPGQDSNQQLSGQSNNILASLNQNSDPEVDEDRAQEALLQSLTPYEVQDLKAMVHSDYIYSRLVESIAPMIYGHHQIKKGLLLQLIGGVSKTTEQESMQLRGDINICIVGDPSTSKSQFLK